MLFGKNNFPIIYITCKTFAFLIVSNYSFLQIRNKTNIIAIFSFAKKYANYKFHELYNKKNSLIA
ncbi:hypothetical protein FSS13T_16910 [Flavobacterium saliperosum S13]|uniref:Uncharacterized protein n=1 Tax=Flavobacterium saliperosum S13 TaxID=1341155 RepID=A0ABN0QFR6_9FLAO|nr:hypothetical protein FSS13T_16910 [Flavobacterium saliperosum S13]